MRILGLDVGSVRTGVALSDELFLTAQGRTSIHHKDVSTDIEAIKKISAGKKYITPALAEHLAANIDRDSERPPHERLSDRELQILCKIASGKTTMT